MTNLSRWLLNPTMPFSLHLAADVRLSSTDYNDDQVWELKLGEGEDPALALQTSYGGRVGLASILPIWTHDNRTVYETQSYAHQPVITGFAPGYLRIQASLSLQLALLAEYWVIDSHTIGASFTLANAHTSPTTVQLDLFGHVGAQGAEQPLSMVPLGKSQFALHLGKIASINPVVLLEEGTTPLVGGEAQSAKLSRTVEIGGRKKVTVRWVHAGLPTVRESLAQTQFWLQQDWKPFFKEITQATQPIPLIETGDVGTDATIASAFNQSVQAFLKPTSNLPHASIVGVRRAKTGFSPRGNGTHPWRDWNGQSPITAYLVAQAVASIDPQLAQGIIRNFIAVQQSDGRIDWRPGLGGQRQGSLCLPLLARLAWGIFQYTEDDAFIKDVFPGLLKFFNHWMQQDADNDGLPEWQSDNQTGYVFWPTFGMGQAWAQNLDISKVETPDLLAYLLSEAVSLYAMAYYLHDSANETKLAANIEALQAALDSLWNGERYVYRDRDTHVTSSGVSILKNGRGDEEHVLSLELTLPDRIMVRVEGGVNHTPRLTMRLEGLDTQGKAIGESVETDAFVWQNNRGVYTTQQVFSRVDRARFDGLSRVYRVSLMTPDLTELDLNAVLPLWSAGLSAERNQQLIAQITDSEHFWRNNGVTMTSAQSAYFDPANANGSGGVWPFWLTLIGEGLIEAGEVGLAAELIKRLLPVQVSMLLQKREFNEFYHSDQPVGLGEISHMNGIVPLHLLLRVLGIRVINSGKVWTGGPYAWGQSIRFSQHGVVVERGAEGTHITFPSGYEIELDANADWQAVEDPKPARAKALKSFQTLAANAAKPDDSSRPKRTTPEKHD